MSVTIRLARIGRKNQPAYKLVVSNTRDKRNGEFVDILGFYNPYEPTNKFSYNKEKFEEWAKRGALVTDAVKKLIEGNYEYIKYEPKKVEKKERSEESKQQQASSDQSEAEEKAKTEEQENPENIDNETQAKEMPSETEEKPDENKEEEK